MMKVIWDIFHMAGFPLIVLPGWLYWKHNPLISDCLRLARGIVEFITTLLTEIFPLQHNNMHRQTRHDKHDQQDHNCTSTALHLFQQNCNYIKQFLTVAQIENMRIVYHCFTSQFWNLAHVKKKAH